MTRTRTSLLVSSLVLAAVSLGGCSSGDDNSTGSTTTTSASPTAGASSTGSSSSVEGPTVDIKIQGDSATPIAEQVKLKTGETLTLMITSDRPGELHVHSSPEQELQFTEGSNPYTLSFDKPGTVDIEDHETGVLLVRALVS